MTVQIGFIIEPAVDALMRAAFSDYEGMVFEHSDYREGWTKHSPYFDKWAPFIKEAKRALGSATLSAAFIAKHRKRDVCD